MGSKQLVQLDLDAVVPRDPDDVEGKPNAEKDNAEDGVGDQLGLQFVGVVATAQARLALDGREFRVQITVVGVHGVAVEDVQGTSSDGEVQKVKHQHKRRHQFVAVRRVPGVGKRRGEECQNKSWYVCDSNDATAAATTHTTTNNKQQQQTTTNNKQTTTHVLDSFFRVAGIKQNTFEAHHGQKDQDQHGGKDQRCDDGEHPFGFVIKIGKGTFGPRNVYV